MKNDLLPSFAGIAKGLVALFLCSSACVASAQSGDESQLNSAWLRDMKKAWAKRTKSMDTVAIHFAIDDIIKGVGEQDAARGDALFSEPKPVEDLRSKVELDYYFENGKMAFKRSSSKVMDLNDPTKTRPQEVQFAFDGSMNYSLCVETLLPMGSLDVEGSPSDSLITALDYLAVSLWRDPRAVLEKMRYSYGDMVLDEKDLVVDGTPCRRVSIPRKGSKSWTSSLDVSANGDFLPIQWQTWLNEKLSTKLTIKFVNDEALGSRISDWSYVGHDLKGATDKMRRGKVTSFSVGQDIDDSRFEISFPVGTHIIKREGSKKTYFIQSEIELAPMNKEAYGKLPSQGG